MNSLHASLLSRRHALGLLGLGAAASMLPGLSLAAAPTEQRFVFFILRGAMDGLAALLPLGDPDLIKQRGDLVQAENAVALDGFFALHAELAPLKAYYDAGDLLPIHAVASSHRGRSHFEAQDVLEAGLAKPNSSSTGWLNRLLTEYEVRQAGRNSRLGLAIGPTLPLALRGPQAVGSVLPDALPAIPDSFVERIATLWGGDAQLAPALEAAMMMEGRPGMQPNGQPRPNTQGTMAVIELARIAAAQLSRADGPRIAVIELNGFDTHSGQLGRLNQQFKAMAAALAALREGLVPVWRQSAVLAVSEFGRTVAPNGSNGTDHGTGGAAFLLGGDVRGGRVLADWPGLKQGRLFEGRDLAPSMNMVSLYKAVAAGHLGIDGRAALGRIFPDDANLPMADLFKGGMPKA